jgi:hypothetical protein
MWARPFDANRWRELVHQTFRSLRDNLERSRAGSNGGERQIAVRGRGWLRLLTNGKHARALRRTDFYWILFHENATAIFLDIYMSNKFVS